MATLATDSDGDGTVSPGDTLSYKVSIANTGTGVANDVAFADTPGAYTSLVAGSVQAGTPATVTTGNGSGATSIAASAAMMQPGTSFDISFQVTIDPAFPIGVEAVLNQGAIDSRELGQVKTIDPGGSAPGGITRTPVTEPPLANPVVKIAAPLGGAQVTAQTNVTAQITPPVQQRIVSWCVKYRAKGAAAWVELKCEDGAPSGTLATFDPTTLTNGVYELTVEADSSGGGSNSDTVEVAVDGNLKLGRFTTSYRDMSVPISRMPIGVTRTYDSYDKSRGDFGIGWNLGIENFTVQTNGALGEGGWGVQPSGCGSILGSMICLSNSFKRLSPHFVTVRWPDGHQEVFDFTPSAGADIHYDASAAFTARAGSTSTLEVEGDSYIQYLSDGNIYDSDMTAYYNPQRFRLTGKDGTAYVIDSEGGLISATDRLGNTIMVDEDGVHSSAGKSIEFDRDNLGRVTSISGPSGENVDYAYSLAGDLSSVTDARGNTMSFTYNSRHDLLVTKDPLNRAMRTVAYDADGRMTSVTDGAGNTTEIDTEASDRQQIITSPDGDLTTITTRDARGNLTRLQDVAGSTTRTSTFEYDSKDNQTKSVDPLGNVSRSTFDARSNLTSTTDAKGRTTQFEYDANDLPVKVTRPDGTVAQTITRDADGNPTQVDSGGGEVTNFTYDALGRLINSSDPLGRFVETEYDAIGNPVEMRDPAGVALTTVYDASNRPVSTTNALGATATSTYDVEGNVIQATDAKGHSTQSTYDFAGRRLTQTDQLGRVASNTYDESGRLASMTDRNGDVTNLEYDENGAVTRMISSDGTELETDYDAFGRQVASSNNHARIEQAFDLNDRVTSISTNGVAGSPQPTTTATYTYDIVGNRLTETTSRGTSSFAYDARDRLTSITDPQIGSFNYSYDSKDRLTSLSRPNGVTTGYSRNVVGDLTDIVHVKGATTVDQARYTYDALGQIATMSDPAGTHSYSYDATGQLTAVNHPAAQPDEAFSYDLAGNRTSNGEMYDDANSLLLDNEFSYTYDDEGNLLSKSDRVIGTSTTFDWDANQRQRSGTKPNGETTEYRFDPRGRRIETSGPAGTDRFGFGVSSNPLFEYDSGGSIEASYVFGFGSDKPLAMGRGGQNHFQLQDMLANVTSLTNAVGSKVESYKYSAFGKQDNPVSAVGNPFSFAGREWDEESSTYYNRARQFDPSSGRFTSEDPIPSSNGYPYAGNDPVSSRDPSGLFSLSEVTGAIGIRGELAAEQIGFGLNLLAAIGGNGPSAKDVGVVAAGTLVGLGAFKVVRTIRSIRAMNKALASLSPSVRANVDDAIGRAASGTKRFPGHDGKPYRNDDGLLPPGRYEEWTAAEAGSKRGLDRVIIEGNGMSPNAIYYWDHINPPVRIGP